MKKETKIKMETKIMKETKIKRAKKVKKETKIKKERKLQWWVHIKKASLSSLLKAFVVASTAASAK